MEDKNVVEGYVFECEGHGFLGEYFNWHPSKKKPEEGYVFPSGMLEKIISIVEIGNSSQPRFIQLSGRKKMELLL